MANSPIVVTGGSGFIGTNLVALLQRSGLEVRNYDRNPPLDKLAYESWCNLDLDDSNALYSRLRMDRPNTIIHLAAETKLGGTDPEFAGNISQARQLLDAAHSIGSPRIILASTMLVHPLGTQLRSDIPGTPTTPYGRSKAAMEEMIREHPFRNWSIIRPTTIWGPWHVRLANEFIARMSKGWYVHPAVSCRRSYGYVGNVCHQIIKISQALSAVGKCYFVGDPAIELGRYVDAFSQRLCSRPARRVPIGLLATVAFFGDAVKAVGVPFPLTSYRLGNMTKDNVIDMSETINLSGPGPISLEEGVGITVEWWLQYMQKSLQH